MRKEALQDEGKTRNGALELRKEEKREKGEERREKRQERTKKRARTKEKG